MVSFRALKYSKRSISLRRHGQIGTGGLIRLITHELKLSSTRRTYTGEFKLEAANLSYNNDKPVDKLQRIWE